KIATYKLEKTPNTFISAFYPDNRFVYRVVHIINEANHIVISDIDLRKDNLSINGTEIKEPVLQKLYGSLRLRPSLGRVYVNCNGACYIVVVGKEIYHLIDNVFFDWSCFGVVVPNSVKDKDEEFESSDNEVKERVTKLEELLSLSEKENEDTKIKLQIMQDQLSSVETTLQSTKVELDSSSEFTKELKCQLASCMKYNEDSVIELHKVQNELSNDNLELQTKLESSYEKLKQHEEQLSTCNKLKKEKQKKHNFIPS
ncbi:Liprin-alpha-1, partial [Bienertia sinuspersici]